MTWPPCAVLLWFTNCLLWLKVALYVPQAKGSWLPWLFMCLFRWLLEMNPSGQSLHL